MSHMLQKITKHFQWVSLPSGTSMQHERDIVIGGHMDFDPHAWAQAAANLKTAFDMFRSAIGLYRDIRPGTENPEQTRAITAALDQAEAAAKIAEADIAKVSVPADSDVDGGLLDHVPRATSRR